MTAKSDARAPNSVVQQAPFQTASFGPSGACARYQQPWDSRARHPGAV